MNTTDPLEWSSIAVGQVWTRMIQSGPHQASEAVVFLHGNPGSASDWVDLVTEVGESRRAVAFDLPDFGQTVAAPDFGNSLEEYSEFFGEALDTLGISRVQLVLHDLGGLIGLSWAVQNLDKLAGVTLIDTGVMPGFKWHSTARAWQTPVLGEVLQAVTTRAMFRRVTSKAEPRGLPREYLDEMYGNYDRRTRAAVLKLYRDLKAVAGQSDLIAMPLKDADIPCLVIWGAHDRYLGPEFAERQKEAFPSAEVHVLAESGHWPHIDDPATTTGLITRFLRRSE